MKVSTTWDPLGTSSNREGIANLTDVDPLRMGTQANIYIDTRASNLSQNDVNSFIKFVSQDSINQAQTSGQPLEDLDGNLIDQEGWYDFTQRRDNTGALTGDGANLIFNGQGLLQGVNLTLTDNRFGDSDPAAMQLSDPGAIAFKAAAPAPSPSPSPSPSSPVTAEDATEPVADDKPDETDTALQPTPSPLINSAQRTTSTSFSTPQTPPNSTPMRLDGPESSTSSPISKALLSARRSDN